MFLFEVGAHGRVPLQVHEDGENHLCGHTVLGLLENICLASPLQGFPEGEEAAAGRDLCSRDESLRGSQRAKRKRQDSTVVFPMLFYVSRMVVIPVICTSQHSCL